MNDDVEEAVQKENLKRKELRQRLVLVFCTGLYTTFYAGAFFGYGPMQLMLEDNGSFASRCTESNKEQSDFCPEQTSRLLNVHLVAQISLLFSPPAGALTDRYGSFRCMTLVSALAWSGLAFLTIAIQSRIDNLLFLAFFLLGLNSVTAHQTLLQAGMLFEGVQRQRILSILNSLFDIGSLTYLMLWSIQKAANAQVHIIILLYLVFSLPIFALPIYLWKEVLQKQTATVTPPMQPDVLATTNTTLDISTFCAEKDSNIEEKAADQPPVLLLSQEKETDVPAVDAATLGDVANDCYIQIRDRLPMEQVKSKLFVLLMIFFAFHGAMNNFTLTTARDQLAFWGDDDTGNKYLTIFTLLTLVSLVGLPLQDYVLKHYGFYGGFQFINILSILHGIIKISSTNLNVQIIGFIAFSFFRCFMFTITFSFLPVFLSKDVVGRCAGILVLCQGITPGLNIPLSQLAIKYFDGDFFYPNLFYTAGVLPMFVLVWFMGQRMKLEQPLES